MRKFLIPLAAAVSTVALAAPASAQVRVSIGTAPYGYNPYVQQGYGYNPYVQQRYGNQGYAQQLAVRINRIQSEIRRLAQYRMISRAEYNNRIRESREIERRFYRNARDGRGLTQRETYDVQQRVQRLEYRLQRDVRDGRQWGYRW